MYKRTKVFGKSKLTTDEAFPFLKLPAEIRNMIYRYLVVSRSASPINLTDTSKWYTAGGIQTAILCANKQVFDEAANILYSENRCEAVWSWYYQGVAFRIDQEKSKSTTSRTLRSGRAVDMLKYKGIIYEKVFMKLKNVELKVTVLPCGGHCDYHDLRLGIIFQQNLESLYRICSNRQASTYAREPSGKNWELVISGTGNKGHGRRFLELILDPIIDGGLVFRVVKLGKMSMAVRGNWGTNWQNLFRKFRKLPGFSANKVVEVDVGRVIPRRLMDIVEEEGVDGFMELPPWLFW